MKPTPGTAAQYLLEEQAIYAGEGLKGLQDFWRAAGRPDRVLVFDQLPEVITRAQPERGVRRLLRLEE